MISVNQNYLKLQKSYLFTDIAHKVAAYKNEHPEARVISLGIGDVTRPLAPAVISALQKAVAEMGTKEGFHGYGPEHGYLFLREAVAREYAALGVKLDTVPPQIISFLPFPTRPLILSTSAIPTTPRARS